jgi:hypothetical protein
MASLTIETPALVAPVCLQEAKDFCRVSITDDDWLFTEMIAAATDMCESWCNRSFVNKGFVQGLDAFPYFVDTVMSQMAYPPSYYALPRYSTTLWNYSQMIKLFRPPLVSVDRISYLAASDSQWHDLTPIPPVWYPGKQYTASPTMQVTDGNGNIQTCITPGISDHHPPNNKLTQPPKAWLPTWGLEAGDITTENTGVEWENSGRANYTPAPGNQFGTYMTDTMSEPARLFPGPPGAFWPQVLYANQAVQIHFTAGYGPDASFVPAGIKMAIKQLLAGWYENRESMMPGNWGELPNHIKMLLWRWRIVDHTPTRG